MKTQGQGGITGEHGQRRKETDEDMREDKDCIQTY